MNKQFDVLAKVIGVLLASFACQAFVLLDKTSGTSMIRHHHKWIRGIQSANTSLAVGLFGPKETKEAEHDHDFHKRIMEIPVKSIKKGGLRMVIGLCLIGLQNTPDDGSWRANQASDAKLDMYFRDNSAKFSVVLEDSCIAVDRYGKASLPYLLQESVILHSVLDELNELAFSSEVELENRLLQLEGADAIEEARSTLPARQA